MHELFLTGTRMWNTEEVYKSFLSLEAREVLKVKPSSFSETDVLAWAFEKHGVYSVRSAYSLLKQEQMEKTLNTTKEASGSEDNHAWSSLWKLEVPPKIRVFWWRVLNNSLPSKSELKRRHVARESHCEMCGGEDESLFHIFFDCPFAKRFWREVKRIMGVNVPDLHPASWASDILHPGVCPTSTVATVISGAWALWTGRNARRYGRKVWEPGAAARFISSLMEDLISLKQPATPKAQVLKAKWERPEPNWFKVNTDASFDQSSCTSSVGIVIRDHSGRVIGGVARWFDDVPDALTAEALAAKEGLELAAELGLNKILLEVDCQALSNFLQGPQPFTSSIGGLCFDILELGKSFPSFSNRWIRRDANSVAHACASLVSAAERAFFWIDCIPNWLVMLAASDCTLAGN